ncbi:hypothetical protein EVAR_61860_1 [Eumeta japonica]|uniref:Uncharacterized protein n=1 Tax=Eumeta variegata TaxID=151549 RepID=A0A4C1ZB79_EUMVA|nr:hypothetical protein EVAR_61860_1 [Eumeta japonica]
MDTRNCRPFVTSALPAIWDVIGYVTGRVIGLMECGNRKLNTTMYRRKAIENEYVMDVTPYKNRAAKLPTRPSPHDRPLCQAGGLASADQSPTGDEYVSVARPL